MPASKMPAEGLARKPRKKLGPQLQQSIWGKEVLLSLDSIWTEKGLKENRKGGLFLTTRRTIQAETGAINTENQAPQNCGENWEVQLHLAVRTGGKLQGPDHH